MLLFLVFLPKWGGLNQASKREGAVPRKSQVWKDGHKPRSQTVMHDKRIDDSCAIHHAKFAWDGINRLWNGCTFGQHVSRKASKIAFTFDFPDEWWIRKFISGEELKLDQTWNLLFATDIVRNSGSFCTVAYAKHQYHCKYHERGPVQRNELWGHPQK